MASFSDPSMPPRGADLSTMWAYIKEGFDQVFAKNSTSLSYAKYSGLSTVVYNCCKADKDRGQGSVASDMKMSSDLYDKVVQYFAARAKTINAEAESLKDEALLRYYAEEWDRYTAGASSINRLCHQLNRHWVNNERAEGRTGVVPVYTAALIQWKIEFFLRVQTRNSSLTGAVLCLIEQERNGDPIDQDLVKKVIDSFVSLGLCESDINKVSYEVYKEYFEDLFLAATEMYYRGESEALLAKEGVSGYLKKAEERLQEEENRVERYLDSSTRDGVMLVCDKVLIRGHAKRMWDCFSRLLDEDSQEDLQRMYGLLARLPEGLAPLRTKFEEHVRNTGLMAVAQLVGMGREVDPKAYADTLLGIHQKHSDTIRRSFQGDAGFVASLDKACRDFVNHNAVTHNSTTQSSELLAKRVEALVRRSNEMPEGEDRNDALDRVIALVKYVEDKDAFRHLVGSASALGEDEAIMVSKLREACGFE